jgi:hypothetical protein
VVIGKPGNWRDYQMTNCGISIVQLGTDPRLLVFDQTSHLEDIGASAWIGPDAKREEPPEPDPKQT